MDATTKAIDSLGLQLLKCMITELQLQSPRYQSMTQDQQQDVIDRMRDAIADQVNHAVHTIAARSYEALPVSIVKAQVKDGIQFQINVIGKPNTGTWVDQIGKEAMLVFCDPTGFTLGLESFRAPAKQRDAFEGE